MLFRGNIYRIVAIIIVFGLRLTNATESRECYDYLFFFLWRFLRKRFFRLWVAILCLLRFFPQGIVDDLSELISFHFAYFGNAPGRLSPLLRYLHLHALEPAGKLHSNYRGPIPAPGSIVELLVQIVPYEWLISPEK